MFWVCGRAKVIKSNVVSKWPDVKPHSYFAVHVVRISTVGRHSASPDAYTTQISQNPWILTFLLQQSRFCDKVYTSLRPWIQQQLLPKCRPDSPKPHCTIACKLDNEEEAQTRTDTSRSVCVVTRIIQVMRFKVQSPSWDAYSLSAHVTLRHFRDTNVH